MIKLAEIIGYTVDKPRLQLAFDFFIKTLSLPESNIKLNFTKFSDDIQANVVVSKRNNVLFYDVNVRINAPMSPDEQIKHLAHEMVHIDQMNRGIFNLETYMWNGVQYPRPSTDQEEKTLPWEKDARVRSPNLVIEFNRYMRDRN